MNLTPEDRDDLATQALLAERRNQPRGIVILCGLIASIAFVLLLVSLSSFARARESRASQLEVLGDIQNLAVELQELGSSSNPGGGTDPFDPIPGILSQMESLAIAAGLEKPDIPNTDRVGQNAIRETQWKYKTSRENDIEKVITWIDSVVSNIPGVFVQRLRIDPQATSWNVDITFSRWERE